MNRSDSRITIRRIDIMPSIKQNTAQQRALVNISSQLDAVKSMNDILSGEAKDTFIGFPSGSGRSRGIIKIPVEADSKEYQKLLRVVRDIRRQKKSSRRRHSSQRRKLPMRKRSTKNRATRLRSLHTADSTHLRAFPKGSCKKI